MTYEWVIITNIRINRLKCLRKNIKIPQNPQNWYDHVKMAANVIKFMGRLKTAPILQYK